MKIVAVLSDNGGAGKTTFAVHLATAAQLAGLDTAVIDLDPQGSAADWCDRRASKPEAVAIPPSRLEKLLADLRANEADLVVIDTGRDSNNAGYTAARAADLSIIPMQIGGFDYQALDRTLDMCDLAQANPWLLLNGVRPGAIRVAADARDSLQQKIAERQAKGKGAGTIPIAPQIFHERSAYRTASITTQTAQEFEPDSPAAAEVNALFQWVSQQLGLSPTGQRDNVTTRKSGRKAAA